MKQPQKRNARVGRSIPDVSPETGPSTGTGPVHVSTGGEREIGLGRVVLSVGASLLVLVGVGVAMNQWMSSVNSNDDSPSASALASNAVGHEVVTTSSTESREASGPTVMSRTTDRVANLPTRRMSASAAVPSNEGVPPDEGAPNGEGSDDRDEIDGARARADTAVSAASSELEVVVSDRALVAAPEHIAIVVDFATGEALFANGSYVEASAQFAAYAAVHPQSPWGSYMEALSLWKSGQALDSEEAFLRALDSDPGHLKSLINLTRVRMDLQKYEEARLPIERALGIAPQRAEIHRVLARVEHNLGNVEAAEASYLQGLRIEPEDFWSLNNLGLLRIEAGRFEEALAPLALARAIDPESAVVQNNLGTALERAGDLKGAERAFARASVIDSSHVRAANSRERVTVRLDQQSRPSVDLGALALRFGEELAATDSGSEVEAVPFAAVR